MKPKTNKKETTMPVGSGDLLGGSVRFVATDKTHDATKSWYKVTPAPRIKSKTPDDPSGDDAEEKSLLDPSNPLFWSWYNPIIMAPMFRMI